MGHLGRGGVEPALLNNKPCEGSGGMGALDFVAAATEEFSGSDLMELCSQASVGGWACMCLGVRWM